MTKSEAIKVSKELNPCPFCGGKAYITVLNNVPYIDCHHLKRCIAKPSTWLNSDKSIKKQVKQWNRRDGL